MRIKIALLIVAAASALAVAACGGGYYAPYSGQPLQEWGGASTCPSC
jgi:hypothetical protein